MGYLVFGCFPFCTARQRKHAERRKYVYPEQRDFDIARDEDSYVGQPFEIEKLEGEDIVHDCSKLRIIKDLCEEDRQHYLFLRSLLRSFDKRGARPSAHSCGTNGARDIRYRRQGESVADNWRRVPVGSLNNGNSRCSDSNTAVPAVGSGHLSDGSQEEEEAQFHGEKEMQGCESIASVSDAIQLHEGRSEEKGSNFKLGNSMGTKSSASFEQNGDGFEQQQACSGKYSLDIMDVSSATVKKHDQLTVVGYVTNLDLVAPDDTSGISPRSTAVGEAHKLASSPPPTPPLTPSAVIASSKSDASEDVPLSTPTSAAHSDVSPHSFFTEAVSGQQSCSYSSSAFSSDEGTPSCARSSNGLEGRPTTVTSHWSKGIPNSTTKYKEDQKVSWHATPFEVRLERALARQKRTSQKRLFDENAAGTSLVPASMQ